MMQAGNFSEQRLNKKYSIRTSVAASNCRFYQLQRLATLLKLERKSLHFMPPPT